MKKYLYKVYVGKKKYRVYFIGKILEEIFDYYNVKYERIEK